MPAIGARAISGPSLAPNETATCPAISVPALVASAGLKRSLALSWRLSRPICRFSDDTSLKSPVFANSASSAWMLRAVSSI